VTFRSTLKSSIRKAANLVGYDFVGFDRDSARWRLKRWLGQHEISLVLDVGANVGHFALSLRELGYQKRIVSFEPMRSAFRELQRNAAAGQDWEALPYALGASEEERLINVAANSQSSSLLPMLDTHSQAAPESVYEWQEQVFVRRLDQVFSSFGKPSDRVFLKIDTQGFEKRVLAGSGAILNQIQLVQLECSLVPLYGESELIEELIALMRNLGYAPVDIQPTFRHYDNAHLMQADVLFLRN
jgi:FkbM family methyltransferase